MTVIISYETISPVVLIHLIESRWNCMAIYRELDEESFELSVWCEEQNDLQYIEDFLGRYV